MHKTIDFSSPLHKAETVMMSEFEEFEFNILWSNVEFFILLDMVFNIVSTLLIFITKPRFSFKWQSQELTKYVSKGHLQQSNVKMWSPTIDSAGEPPDVPLGVTIIWYLSSNLRDQIQSVSFPDTETDALSLTIKLIKPHLSTLIYQVLHCNGMVWKWE